MSSFEYEFRTQYIKNILKEVSKNAKIAIFGAGKHTDWLIETVRATPADYFIIDEFSQLKSIKTYF